MQKELQNPQGLFHWLMIICITVYTLLELLKNTLFIKSGITAILHYQIKNTQHSFTISTWAEFKYSRKKLKRSQSQSYFGENGTFC